MSGVVEEKEENGVKVRYIDGYEMYTLPVIGYEIRKSTYTYLIEAIAVFFAIISISTSVTAYKALKAAGTDVTGITQSWEMKPIIKLDYSPIQTGGAISTCPLGYVPMPDLQPDDGSLGCACNKGARGKLDSKGNNKMVDVQSTQAPCWTNQTSIPQYKCADIAQLPLSNNAVNLKSWKGALRCIKKGTANALDQKTPDADGKCPDGFIYCGSPDKKYMICEPGTSSSVCPYNWIAATNTLTTTYALTAEEIQGLNNRVNGNDALQAPYPTKNYGGAANQVHYAQVGTSSVASGVTYVSEDIQTSSKYIPLPIVEAGVALSKPCYGVADALTKNTKLSNSLVTTGDGLSVNVGGGGKCEQKNDDRYFAADTRSASDLLKENILYGKDYCNQELLADGTVKNPSAYDYWSDSAQKCTTSSSAANECLDIKAPGDSTMRFTRGNCATNDKICQQASYQSKCGILNTLTSTQFATTWYRTQTYWTATCPYTKQEVVTAAAPLQKSINWQTALLYINILTNLGIILLGLYIMKMIYNDARDERFENIEEVQKPRFVTIATVIKVPIISAVIVFTKAIQKFYVTLATGDGCSDPVTNGTFSMLAEALPGVVSANSATLAMDLLGFLPMLYGYFFPPKKGDAKDDGDVKNTELTAPPAPVAPAAPVVNPMTAPPPAPAAPVYTAPPPAPAAPTAPIVDDPWEEKQKVNGDIYYRNKITGEVSESKPEPVAGVAAAASDVTWEEKKKVNGDSYWLGSNGEVTESSPF